MLPMIAMMIATYGCCRLLNDCLARHPGRTGTVTMWLFSIFGGIVLCVLAVMILVSGASVGNLMP